MSDKTSECVRRSPSPLNGDLSCLGSNSRNLPKAKAPWGPSERERASHWAGVRGENVEKALILQALGEAHPSHLPMNLKIASLIIYDLRILMAQGFKARTVVGRILTLLPSLRERRGKACVRL